jgi:hypothetical protein
MKGSTIGIIRGNSCSHSMKLTQCSPILKPRQCDLPTSTRINLLGAFARWVRIGKYTQDGGTRVKCQTVQVTLRAIRVTFKSDGKPNLTNCSKGQYWLTIERQLEGYHHEDPLAWAKLAMPIKVVNHIHVIAWKCKSNRKDESCG